MRMQEKIQIQTSALFLLLHMMRWEGDHSICNYRVAQRVMCLEEKY